MNGWIDRWCEHIKCWFFFLSHTFQCGSSWCARSAGPPHHPWTTSLWPYHQTPRTWTWPGPSPWLSDQQCPAAPPAVFLPKSRCWGKKKHRTRVQAGVREKPSRAEALDGNSLTPAAISFTFVLEPLDPEACGSNQLHPQHGEAGG